MEWKCKEALRGELDEDEERLRRDFLRGWYIGDTSFRDRMKDRLDDAVHGKAGSYTGAAKRLHDEKAAKTLLSARLKSFGLTKKDLRALKPGTTIKQMMAALLRKQTTMTRQWIVKELDMGSESSVYNAVKAVENMKGKAKREWDEFQK